MEEIFTLSMFHRNHTDLLSLENLKFSFLDVLVRLATSGSEAQYHVLSNVSIIATEYMKRRRQIDTRKFCRAERGW